MRLFTCRPLRIAGSHFQYVLLGRSQQFKAHLRTIDMPDAGRRRIAQRAPFYWSARIAKHTPKSFGGGLAPAGVAQCKALFLTQSTLRGVVPAAGINESDRASG